MVLAAFVAMLFLTMLIADWIGRTLFLRIPALEILCT